MKLKEFQLGELFAKYRARAKYVLSAASCESVSMQEIIDMADSECKALWDNLRLGYTAPQGCRLLRDAVANRFMTIRHSDILELAPEEGIFIFMNVLLDPGDEVIVMQPCLPSLYELPRALGCKIIRWPLEISSWGWKLDVNFLAENISQKTKLLVLNIPNNPTGYIPVRTEMDRILSLADKMGTWVFCEETYRGLEHDPGAALHSLADQYTRAVIIGGLNKYGLPGTRMGWLVTKNKQILSESTAYKDYTTLCNNGPGEILATIAMRNAATLLKRNHEIVLKNLDMAGKFFNKHKRLFQWVNPDGGATAFPKLLPPHNVMDMCDRAMSEKDLLVVGDRNFDLSNNHFRVGLGRSDFTAALDLFEELIDPYYA